MLFFLLFSCFLGLAWCDILSPNSKSHPLRLWYTSPALYWNDSLPIGNGRLGGMVKGSPSSDLVYMNEDSFWSGGPLNRTNLSAFSSWQTVQQLLLQGNVSAATFEANLGLAGVPSSTREYMPGGDFQIVFQNQAWAQTYERWLDLSDGTAGVYYTAGSVAYQREYLSSAVADVVAIHLTASVPGSLNFYIKFQRSSSSQNRFAETAYAENGDTIVSTFLGNQIRGVFAAQVRTTGGSKRQVGDQILVTGADEAWIVTDIETSVREPNPLAAAKKKLASALSSTYDALRSQHVADYQTLFNRASLSLGASSEAQKALSTDQRRQALARGEFDAELASLYFQFGRYLLISSSRPHTLPPNLQGIWNNDMNPAWGSKYTVNINLQMNYWPAEVTNLPELTEPLFSLLETAYVSGKKTAKQMYGAGGWCLHHNTDLWGDSAPQDIYSPASYWALGGAWLLQHVYEHYLFTGDKAFLKKYYYLLYEAAQFFHDTLDDYQGWKVTNPSVSPENSYRNGSVSGAMTVGSTIDNSILRELFANLRDATTILDLPHTPLVAQAMDLHAKLPPLRVSPTTSVLMEWIEDFVETDPGHRHLSPVYGLYPGREITPSDATIWNASRAFVDRRVYHGSGNIGWSRAWIMSLHARLHDGRGAENDLFYLLSNLTYNSLLDSGPPAGFQIDGNFGGCAAIAETLLQSHNGVVKVLPALLPSALNGSFSGLVARGGFVVNATWANGLVSHVAVLSRLGNLLNLTLGTGQSLSLSEALPFNSSRVNASVSLTMKTAPGATYNFVTNS
ncbi:hypothetical protein HMPREF1624_05551 [Sporothrix schenckii ATCC 58251]|uniref:Uncharacterized protein n=1 Tax=Sporothrix schenckii (strain ATCC 58251 / de Perez 2211183) TaxID=1391915 RepID=U7PSZ4_SPOS1|nr:hypothetical protein HMPREF1624_05551 [Sporothrix schenckii ATCC 58251]